MPVPSSDRGDTNGRDAPRLKRLADLQVVEVACDDGQRTLVVPIIFPFRNHRTGIEAAES